MLVQIGKLEAKGLPVVGAEAARKLDDEAMPSNTLMRDVWRQSANKPI